MFKEVHWYFNATALNKLVNDAGYNGIKDFAERSGITISYKTIKRACNDGHCTRRTFYAIACKLAETFGWTADPIGTLKTTFEIAQFDEDRNAAIKHEKECNDDVSCLIKEFPKKLEQCIVYLSDGREALVQGKSIYWDWYDRDSTICFYDEGAEHGEGDGDLKIAEFDKAAVLCIIRQFKE